MSIEPSQICITGGIPLTGTFNHTECELAAGMLIMACQDKGDWSPTLPKEIGESIKKHVDEPAFLWLQCPLVGPDFVLLTKEGFIEGMGEDRKGAISFTEKGLAALESSRWVYKAKK